MFKSPNPCYFPVLILFFSVFYLSLRRSSRKSKKQRNWPEKNLRRRWRRPVISRRYMTWLSSEEQTHNPPGSSDPNETETTECLNWEEIIYAYNLYVYTCIYTHLRFYFTVWNGEKTHLGHAHTWGKQFNYIVGSCLLLISDLQQKTKQCLKASVWWSVQ